MGHICTQCCASCDRIEAGAQVRCMAAVLLMVGRGLEQPSVVQCMLDVQATRQKPQYNMAAEVCVLWHHRSLERVGRVEDGLFVHVCNTSLGQQRSNKLIC